MFCLESKLWWYGPNNWRKQQLTSPVTRLIVVSENFTQGAPETGTLPGAPSRNFSMTIPEAELEYAPVTGLTELREKVADYYNHLYRQGKTSQYTMDNVCVVPGGRAGLTRIMAVLGDVNIGYFTPDYTAYEQCLGLFLRISPSPLLHRDINTALMEPDEFEFQCKGAGLGSVLLSNPANPTGQSIEGEKLQRYVEIARNTETALLYVVSVLDPLIEKENITSFDSELTKSFFWIVILSRLNHYYESMDEFYSHYYYDGEATDPLDGGIDVSIRREIPCLIPSDWTHSLSFVIQTPSG